LLPWLITRPRSVLAVALVVKGHCGRELLAEQWLAPSTRGGCCSRSPAGSSSRRFVARPRLRAWRAPELPLERVRCRSHWRHRSKPAGRGSIRRRGGATSGALRRSPVATCPRAFENDPAVVVPINGN